MEDDKPIVSAKVRVDHLKDTKPDFAEIKAPPEAISAFSLEFPVKPEKKALKSVGKLMGKVALLVGNATPFIREMVPSFIGMERMSVKRDDGSRLLRLSLFFSQELPATEQLDLLKSIVMSVQFGKADKHFAKQGDDSDDDEDDEDEEERADSENKHDEDAAAKEKLLSADSGVSELAEQKNKENADTADGDSGQQQEQTPQAEQPKQQQQEQTPQAEQPKQQQQQGATTDEQAHLMAMANADLESLVASENTDGDGDETAAAEEDDPLKPRSLFAELPDADEMAVTTQLDVKASRFLVTFVQDFLQKKGYHRNKESGAVLTKIIMLVSMLDNVRTSFRFRNMKEVFADSPEDVGVLSMTMQKIAMVPSEKLIDVLLLVFGNGSAEELAPIVKLYTSILDLCVEAIDGHNGRYSARVLSGNARLQVDVTGIDPFPLFPPAEAVIKLRQERDEAARRRAAEALAMAGIPRFEDSDFDEFEAKLNAKIAAPWRRTFPPAGEEHRYQQTQVWINEKGEYSEFPLIKVRGVLVGVTADQAFSHFFVPKNRLEWDDFMGECRVLERFPESDADVFHSVFRTPPTVANREFVEYRRVKRTDDGILVLARSCDHAKAPMYAQRVRGTTLYSGYSFRTVFPNDPNRKYSTATLNGKTKNATMKQTGPCYTIVTGVVQQDYGGHIPRFMLSQLNEKVVAQWMYIFTTSCIQKMHLYKP
eukprot:TRINITY_DN58717_c0_g1_i1.p1 TRINITY_DN58717_c0_g1~~TRINITY_DN58717_c0_g1_i1.p1  ORF type:complete len:833 (+),score=441.89 TRINITY_DN58717_c0_g1_i1:375-2501(+)